jgi:hypothetical protein
MLNTLLALGLLLTTASQLRVRGSPIGLGEIILVSWSIFVIMRGWLLREFQTKRKWVNFRDEQSKLVVAAWAPRRDHTFRESLGHPVAP